MSKWSLALTETLFIKKTDNNTVNTNSTFNIEFSLQYELIEGDSIKINLPMGFSFFEPRILHRGIEGCTETQILPNERMLMCRGFKNNIEADNWEIISITGVISPRYSKRYSRFSIEHFQGETNHVLEKVSTSEPIFIAPGEIKAVFRKTSQFEEGEEAYYQIDLTLTNEIYSDEELWVKLPFDFYYLSKACSIPEEGKFNIVSLLIHF